MVRFRSFSASGLLSTCRTLFYRKKLGYLQNNGRVSRKFVPNSGRRRISPQHIDRRNCCLLRSTDDRHQFITRSVKLYEGRSIRTVPLIKHVVNIEKQDYYEVVPPLMYTTYHGFIYDVML